MNDRVVVWDLRDWLTDGVRRVICRKMGSDPTVAYFAVNGYGMYSKPGIDHALTAEAADAAVVELSDQYRAKLLMDLAMLDDRVKYARNSIQQEKG